MICASAQPHIAVSQADGRGSLSSGNPSVAGGHGAQRDATVRSGEGFFGRTGGGFRAAEMTTTPRVRSGCRTAPRSRTHRTTPGSSASGGSDAQIQHFFASGRRWRPRDLCLYLSCTRPDLIDAERERAAPSTARGTSICPTSTSTKTGGGEGADRPVDGCVQLGQYPCHTEPGCRGREGSRSA
jgi:hypothetical protein